MYRDILGFSITPFMQRVMDINGFFASIMRTGKKSEGSDDKLPPGVPIPVLPVDYLKVRPDSWLGGAGAFVVPIDSGWGLWFNFTMNNPSCTAVLPSVKGMNPLTGQRVAGYDIQEFQEECPVHKKLFSKGRLCTECGFKWPAQNFLSKPNPLYIDGFRTPDGNVRQFYFTEDMAKSVPELVIGKEDTVPAFGFCFYKLKDFKPNWEKGEHVKNEFPSDFGNNGFLYKVSSEAYVGPMRDHGLSHLGVTLGSTCDSFSGPIASGLSECSGRGDVMYRHAEPDYSGSELRERSDSRKMSKRVSTKSITKSSESPSVSCFYSAQLSTDSLVSPAGFVGLAGPAGIGAPLSDREMKTSGGEINFISDAGMEAERSFAPERMSAEVGIGAGSKIKQDFKKSSKSLEDWEKKPAGIIRLYFVFQEEFEKYAACGFNDLKGSAEGYLEGVPVGGSNE